MLSGLADCFRIGGQLTLGHTALLEESVRWEYSVTAHYIIRLHLGKCPYAVHHRLPVD